MRFSNNKGVLSLLVLLVVILSYAGGKLYLRSERKTDELSQLKSLANEKLVATLRVYDVYNSDNEKLKFVRHGKQGDGGYVVAEVALSKADAVMGYGIADDISFEEEFSNQYNKPSYGFDCGIEDIKIKNKLCKFTRECVASDKFLYGQQKSSLAISTYPKQLQKLGLEKSNVFIKMDIEGAEYAAFEDIYKYAPQITGIALEIHFEAPTQVLEATHLISRLNQDFYLIHVHCNNCCNPANVFSTSNATGRIATVLELSFINKSLVHHASASKDQSHPQPIDMVNCPTVEDVSFVLKEE